jgi:nicotinamide-nucleotide amidase
MGMELKKLISSLAKRNLTIATAESASGGYLSYLLTKTPGSSIVFKGGMILYSLESKHKFFNIPSSLLDTTQGVSKDVSLILAKRIMGLYNAVIGLAIVGFAGPDKRSSSTGLYYIAVATKRCAYAKRLRLTGSRDRTRILASMAALDLLNKKFLCERS